MASFSHFSPKRTLTFSWTEKVSGSLCLNCHSKLPFSHHGGSHSKALHFQKGLAPGWQFIGHSTGESEWHQTPRHSLLKNRAFFGSHQTSCCITFWNNARLLTKSSGGGDLGRHPRQQRCKIIRFQWKLRWKRRISCEHGMNMDMRCVKIERSMRSIRLSLELLLMHNSSYQMLLLRQAINHILIPKSAACLCQYVFPNPTVQKISKKRFPIEMVNEVSMDILDILHSETVTHHGFPTRHQVTHLLLWHCGCGDPHATSQIHWILDVVLGSIFSHLWNSVNIWN